MKKLNAIMVTLSLLALPLTAGAMESHGNHGKTEKTEHSSMKGMDHGEHGGMDMHGDMVMLGDQTVDGVKAMAHLNDVKQAMAKVGMKETHHFMVAFVDGSGEQITEGTVAVKIKDPAGNESGPVKLMGMEGHFGADIVLQPGKHEFMVGTKLPDGKTRQYHFEHMVK